jgi:hypothetical protein
MQVETLMAEIPEFLCRMDALEQQWFSIRSSLTIGLSMKLEQYQLVHQQLQQRQTSTLNRMFTDSVNRLFLEIVNVDDKIRQFDSKFSAVLSGEQK